MPKRTKSLDEFLMEHLKDAGEAAAYLSACLDESHEQFRRAIEEVALARGVASVPTIGAEFTVSDVERVLVQLGLKLAVQPAA